MQATEGPSRAQAAPFTCTSAALLQRLLRWQVSEAEQKELARRKWLLGLYVLRDPLFSSAISCALYFVVRLACSCWTECCECASGCWGVVSCEVYSQLLCHERSSSTASDDCMPCQAKESGLYFVVCCMSGTHGCSSLAAC